MRFGKSDQRTEQGGRDSGRDAPVERGYPRRSDGPYEAGPAAGGMGGGLGAMAGLAGMAGLGGMAGKRAGWVGQPGDELWAVQRPCQRRARRATWQRCGFTLFTLVLVTTAAGMAGMGAPMGMMMGNSMVQLVPVQLPNGQASGLPARGCTTSKSAGWCCHQTVVPVGVAVLQQHSFPGMAARGETCSCEQVAEGGRTVGSTCSCTAGFIWTPRLPSRLLLHSAHSSAAPCIPCCLLCR